MVTQQQIDTVFKQARTAIREAMKALPHNIAEMAAVMYREGIRRSKCGDVEQCALAQYFANKINIKGLTVSVGGSEVDLKYKGHDTTMVIGQRGERFVERYDHGEFPFLCEGPRLKKITTNS